MLFRRPRRRLARSLLRCRRRFGWWLLRRFALPMWLLPRAWRWAFGRGG